MRAANNLPLSALLSQALVAFTIEFDNEFEHQMPHRTTHHGATDSARSGPWLVSLAMWSNCMQFVGDDGVRVRDLAALARTETNLKGMERWGYVAIKPEAGDGSKKSPRSQWMIRATSKGRQAREVWRPLFEEIEKRWQARFGQREIGSLRELLATLTSQFAFDLPDCLPILGYGLRNNLPVSIRGGAGQRKDSEGAPLPLPVLLSRVLLAFALEFERESEISLAIGANVLRILGGNAVRVRDLPALSGVSKEAISVAFGFLQKKKLITVRADRTAIRTKVIELTSKGRQAQHEYSDLLREIEGRWSARFGAGTIAGLRESLERFVGEPTAELSPLFRGLDPYPDGWRASVPKPATLPHFPMVLHRGGFPDGS